MKHLTLLTLFLFLGFGSGHAQDQYIFPFGGGTNKLFIKEIIKLTGKEKPKICFLPTASADSQRNIIRWYELVHDMSVIPSHQKVWISSYNQKKIIRRSFTQCRCNSCWWWKHLKHDGNMGSTRHR